MSDKIVDLRKERERREKERRSSSVEKPARENGQKDAAPRGAPRDAQREGLFWETPEYEYYKKQQGVWIRNTLIIAAPLAAIFLLMGNVLGFFIVVFGGAAFLLAAFRKPRIVSYGIEKQGVSVDGAVTPYEKLESFWIFPKEQGNMLSLRRKGHARQHLKVPLGDTQVEVVRSALVSHIEEKEQHPSVTDSWLRRIGY